LNWKIANQLNSFRHNDVKRVGGICEVCVGMEDSLSTFPLLAPLCWWHGVYCWACMY